MERVLTAVHRFVRDERGQDLLEYAMLITLIAVAAIVAVTATGTSLGGVFWGGVAANVAAAL
ncbi:MAG TPA: hypothetical protein VHZ73_10830 [Vicinamibacterales bacterium]|jgi:Flp pilus assembly pilin Flp|nr:hypothetical protein [Vicinamibacterales bacterium]